MFVDAARQLGEQQGHAWKPGRNILISRTERSARRTARPSRPRSTAASTRSPTCVGFLSAASNIVGGRHERPVVDAFVEKINGRRAQAAATRRRASRPCPPPRSRSPATASRSRSSAAASCTSRRAAGRAKHVRARRHRRRPVVRPASATTSCSARAAASTCAKNGTGRPKLVGRGGRNPAYNDIKRQTVAYEKKRRRPQPDRLPRHRQARADHQRGPRQSGNGDSRNPVIGNSGFYVAFQSDASNLQTNAGGSRGDQQRHDRRLPLHRHAQDHARAVGQRPAATYSPAAAPTRA